MTEYENWLVMARASFATGDLAKSSGDMRSAVSRYYYAAYQATTALFLYRGLTPPEEREAWSHEDTRDIIVNDLPPLIKSRDVRKDLRDRLLQLYLLRVIADYRVRANIGSDDADLARRDTGFLLQAARDIIEGGRL